MGVLLGPLVAPRPALALALVVLACGGESVRHGARGGAPLPDFEPEYVAGAAVTYLTNPGHTSSQSGSYLLPPWSTHYATTYGGAVSYPLIVGERFFFTANGEVNHVANVHAKYLDDPADDAWEKTPFETGPLATSGHLAYDRGLVIVADETAHVAALDETTGDIVWTTTLDTTGKLSVPIAVGGAVFVTAATEDGFRLFALREADGSVAYRVPAQEGMPTYGDGYVYTSSDCYETRAVYARTGKEVWHYEGTCSGRGPSPITSYWHGYLFTLSSSGQIGVLDCDAGGTLLAELPGPHRLWPLSFGETPFAVETHDPAPATTGLGLFAYRGHHFVSPELLVPLAGWPYMPLIVTPSYLLGWLGFIPDDTASLVSYRSNDGWSDNPAPDAQFGGVPEAELVGGPLPGMAAGSDRYLVVGWGRSLFVLEAQSIP